MNNKPTQQDLKLTAKLAEIIFGEFHAKVSVSDMPMTGRGFASMAGQGTTTWEESIWTFRFETDLGNTQVTQTDRFGWDIIKISQNLVDKAYRGLAKDAAKQEVIDHIFTNGNNWSNELESLKKIIS